MPAEAISPLRRRLIEDMTIRQFSDKTKKDYIRQVKNFTVFLGRSPDQASNEDVRHYQVHLTAHGISSPSMHADGPGRYKTMTLATGEFIRRFLLHVLPKGFHRIRHYGLLANGDRADNINKARELLAAASRPKEPDAAEAANSNDPTCIRSCPCCGGRMIVIETFERGATPRHRPSTPDVAIRIDTS